MKPIFHPHLVNGPSGDPALYIEMLFEKRALLFDMGDLHALPARKILRLTHVFISHAHMDHFIGFDQVLRVVLGRDKEIFFYGPAGFAEQVAHRLQGYSWNLVHNYATDFIVHAIEIAADGQALHASFSCRQRFQRLREEQVLFTDGIILDEAGFRVRVAVLDHRIPSLAFSLEEKQHINIWKTKLAELGLATGPWLAQLKAAVMKDWPGDTPITAVTTTNERREFKLQDLSASIIAITPGQKIVYVVDAGFTEENNRRIIRLAENADLLFIEATFLQEELAHAKKKYHLTAQQAGWLAKQARVQRLIPFHFSSKYAGREQTLIDEALAAFSAENDTLLV